MAELNGTRPQRPRSLSRTALQRLRQPLDAALVSERTTEDGEVLRYLEGWRVIEQANAIFGHDRWGAELVGEVAYRPLPGGNGRGRSTPAGLYAATVRVTVDGCLPHSDVGTCVVAEHTAESHATACKAAVTDGLKRAATATAVEHSELLIVSRDVMLGLIADTPGLAETMIQSLAGRMRHLVELVEDLSFRHVSERVARILLQSVAPHSGIGAGADMARRVTQREIAEMAGTSREVVARALKAIEATGAISIDRGEITLISPGKLSNFV